LVFLWQLFHNPYINKIVKDNLEMRKSHTGARGDVIGVFEIT
jgi:hypothetical protein